MIRAAALVASLLCIAHPASAQPLRLRGDALAQAETPVGLLALRADGDVTRWISAEALVWTAATQDDGDGDALVIALRMTDPEGRGELRLGRFVQATGALRPIHIDGASGLARLPWQRLRAEAFAGVPVEPGFGADAYDWVAGTRVSRALGRSGSIGLAYLHRRDAGALSDEEIGIDAGGSPLSWLDLSSRVAYDLIDPGIGEAHASAAVRRGAWRGELFGTHRSPSRLLPATSLFSVIGDVPSRLIGSSVRWRAAPRLDVDGTAGVRFIDSDAGATGSLRSTLRLDDRGAGALALQVRRETAMDAEWTGVRAAARLPLTTRLTAAAEAELAFPDDPRGRGAVWPWALTALRWAPVRTWEVAVAVEASASPEVSQRIDILARLAHTWEGL